MCKSILISEVIRDRDGGVRGRQFKQRHTDKFTGNVGAAVKNSDFYMGKSDNFLNKDRGGGGRKTPFEIFLEDDGPYSRKLYGPLKSSQEGSERQSNEKLFIKNFVYKSKDYTSLVR